MPWCVVQVHSYTVISLTRMIPPGCFNITTVFSHAQTVVLCGSCSTVLCQPTGGKARLTEGALLCTALVLRGSVAVSRSSRREIDADRRRRGPPTARLNSH